MSFKKHIKNTKTPLDQGKTVFSFGIICAVLMVSACGLDLVGSGKGAFEGRDIKNARQANIGLNDLRDISTDGTSNQTVESSGVKTGDGKFMALKSKKLLFEEKIRDEDGRFDRIESAVQTIHDEFDKMLPSINRLINIEGDIKELHKQLSLLVENGSLENGATTSKETMTKTASGKKLGKVDLPVPERPKGKKPMAVGKVKTVSSPNVNAADHTGKTRVVFEMPKKEEISINFDSENQLVMVESQANISDSTLNNAIKRSKRLEAVSRDQQSSAIAISTKNIASSSDLKYIGPSAQKNYHRYYFDLSHR